MAKTRRRSAAAPATPPAARHATPSADRDAAAAITPARRRLFVAITLALPWLLLAALELGLRVGGYGGSYPLFVPYPDQPGWLIVNPDVGKRWFRGPFTPTPQVDFFRAEKPAGTFRVFVQGESSAAGFPYGHGGAPSRMLAAEWSDLASDSTSERQEVINTALTAVNSYTLLDQADEIIAQHPDAVLVYTGHNEYYGAFGVGSTSALGRWPALVRAYLALRKLRTVQLLGGLFAPKAGGAAASDAAAAPTTVMELMAGHQRIPLGSARYQEGLDQFRSNLGALLEKYRAHHVRVYVGTLVSNERDQRPFISGYTSAGDSVAWVRSATDAAAALSRGDSATALTTLQGAVRAHDRTADAHYALARLFDVRGAYDSARVHYRAAKELDELRFRAPEAMNRIIREEAARRAATVVETERAFEEASPKGIVGHSLILEHLHPNVDGYSLLAHTFLGAVVGRTANWLPTPAERAAAPVTPVDSVAGWLRIDRLLSGWPFQPRGAVVLQAVDTLRPHDEVERLAQALVRNEISWPEAMDRQRQYFEQRGDAAAAIRVARAMALEYPYSPQPYLDAAHVALAHGDARAATRFARLADDRRPSLESAELLGRLMLRLGDANGAASYLERATKAAPDDKRLRGEYAAARVLPVLMERRTRSPRDTAVLYDLATAYALTEQYDSARVVLGVLQRVAPSHARARALLATLPK